MATGVLNMKYKLMSELQINALAVVRNMSSGHLGIVFFKQKERLHANGTDDTSEKQNKVHKRGFLIFLLPVLYFVVTFLRGGSFSRLNCVLGVQ